MQERVRADHKNQHFVPQFYLKNFSKDGKTIGCLYLNGEHSKNIVNAPIKSQASSDYFYSKDRNLEMEFSEIEANADKIIQNIIRSSTIISSEEEDFIKQYVIFQHIRTPHLANHFEKEMNNMAEKLGVFDRTEARVQITNKQIFVLKSLISGIPALSERLGVIILDNQASTPFITSEEPSVFFNPYMKKRKHQCVGFLSHGTMFYIPLSSKKAILLYDKEAYRISNKHQQCSVADVHQLNAQILIKLITSEEHALYYDNSDPASLNTLVEYKNYVGDYPIFSFVKEKKHLFWKIWV